MDNTEPRIPAVAVASGPHIYIYKNMRPYFKFTLPTLEIHPAEKELWTAASSSSTSEGGSNGGLDLASLLDGLQSLRAEIGDAKLTARTQRLLMINDRNEAQVSFAVLPTLALFLSQFCMTRKYWVTSFWVIIQKGYINHDFDKILALKSWT